MNQYHIRIDGEQSTDSYTYQELVDMGLFELDADSLNGIEIKKITKSNFIPLKSYCFPERQSNEISYYIDEYGQIHRRNISPNNNHNGSYVDEFESIDRPPNSISTSTSSNNCSNSTSSSSSTSNNTTSSEGWKIFFKILGTIIVLAIGFSIAFTIAEAGGERYLVAIPLIAVSWILKLIWGRD